MERADIDIYGGKDPREIPAYSVEQAAHYVRVPRSSLSRWVGSNGVITRPRGSSLLSFSNLVEAHVLESMRHMGVTFQRIRKAVHKVRKEMPGVAHPLIARDFETDGVDLFVEAVGGHYVSVTRDDGQLHMGDVMRLFLRRIARNEQGLASRLFPFTRDQGLDTQGTPITIDPEMAFGQPVLTGTGIPVTAIAQRFHAGDSLTHLAKDYGLDLSVIEDALRAAA